MKRILLLAAVMTAAASVRARADDSANIYAYLLNDYILTYGAYSTENPDDALVDDVPVTAKGVVYAELCDFDFTGDDMLVIYFVNSEENTAACHIWKYNDETKTAERAAVITKPFSIGRYETAVLSQGVYNGRHVVEYSEYNGEKRTVQEVYTLIDSEPVMYVEEPDTELTGVMDYNICRFHSGVDVSGWNDGLTEFFDELKDKSADSVSYADTSDELTDEESVNLYNALSSRLPANGAVYTQDGECEIDAEARIMGIETRCELSGGYEYILFSTDKARYNWAFVENTGEGFSVIREKADAIPLSDSEIERVAYEFGVLADVSAGEARDSENGESADEETPQEGAVTSDSGADRSTGLLPIAAGAAILTFALALMCVLVMFFG